MAFDYPFRLDSHGQTASPDPDDHVRDLIEQVLFTSPGERVNRPTFGTGLLRQVFAPAGDELAAAVQMMVRGALQEWLGTLIEVQQVDVRSREGTLEVTVRYVVRSTGEAQVATFERNA